MNTAISWPSPDTCKETYRFINEKLGNEEQETLNAFFLDNTQRQNQFHFALETSCFFKETIERNPKKLTDLIQHNALEKTLTQQDFSQLVAFDASVDENTFNQHLRYVRSLAMLRIIWRDFNRVASLDETTDDLSYLACECINAALDYHYQALTTKHGEPRNSEGEPQPFLVLGMGKLGANELNLSSDIDLIFTYPENGVTTGKRDLANHEFFTRLGKKIIQSLDAMTADGMVFRVDMRLRPYGQSGSLVYGFDAFEEYYHTQGREWERYAMVKARVIANNGKEEYTHRLNEMLNEFTYRKYIDFSVIDALRNLKKMIAQEVSRRRLEDDVKLGAGGIREIEFTAQVFQLIRGGREASLQDNRLLTILPELEKLRCLPEDAVQALTDAYIFLRNTEHAIQGYKDEQTQKLPDSDEARLALTRVMQFNTWDEFYKALSSHREAVNQIFSDLIAEPHDEASPKIEKDDPCLSLWQQRLDEKSALILLEEYGYENPDLTYKQLVDLEKWASVSSMHSSSRERLDQFMPTLLSQLQSHPHPSENFGRLIQLIKAIARRSAYLLLLIENPIALTQLLKLSEASPWIGDTLAEHPALLDEFLYPESLYNPPQKEELESELQRATLRIAEDDLETQMDTLRYFRSSHALRVAASEISGALPLMKVSDYLTWIAEAILDYVLTLCWNGMVEKHGYPDGIIREKPNFVIIGYGKLGGIELGHGSDLDLVFVHGANLNGASDGKRSLDNQTFFMRLGQKVIHFITTTMTSGALYEVDMRLRPSGNSGMLVTSISSFEKYQRESAWTWEHQALVRARVVSGDPDLTEAFNKVRIETLSKHRNDQQLQTDVIEMRHKMREHLGTREEEGKFHLKHDAGGIVDIEFMVQYAVLAWAHSHPALIAFTDNIRILESLANSNLLEAHEVDQLIEAYKAFRTAGHRLTLQQQPNLMDAKQLMAERQNVIKIWKKLLKET